MTETILDKVIKAYRTSPFLNRDGKVEDAQKRAFNVHYFSDLAKQESVIDDLINIFETLGNVEDKEFDYRYRATSRSILGNAFQFLNQKQKIDVIKSFNKMISDLDLGFETLRGLQSICNVYFPIADQKSQSLKDIFNQDTQNAVQTHISDLKPANPTRKDFEEFLTYIQTLESA